MKISGNDLILLGLCFGIASTIILSKGYIFKDISAIQDESMSYLGANPYAVRNKIIQKWEGTLGFILIMPFAVLQLIGLYLNEVKPKVESILLNPSSNLIFLVLLTICLIWGSNLIAGPIAKNKYIPTLKELLSESFTQTEYVLKNDGLYKKEHNQSQNISMHDRLENWERLFNFRRKLNETDIEYFLKLKEYMQNW